MAKLIAIGNADNHPDYIFICPGCGSQHEIYTSKPNRLGAIWEFDGNIDKPTITPSVNSSAEDNGVVFFRCHFFIKKGKIKFLEDCTHAFSGQTLDLPDIEQPEQFV